MISRIVNVLGTIRRVCGHLCQCVRGNPFACLLLTATFLFLISAILIFNICLAKLFTVPGALMLNLALFWLLLRMLARVLIFPGSIFCWRRNTEASYRVEMSKQFAHHIEHLHAFLTQIDGRNGSMPIAPGVTMEGVMLGSTVVENLARNFRLQQRDQVRFTAEQGRVKLLVQGIENWLLEAKVRERGSKSRGGGSELEVPLTDWLQKMARSIVPVPLNMALQSTELVKGAEASQCVDRLEQLLAIFDGLQCPKDGCCVNARRFLRVPTVGSLHQLRAELQARYQGKHYWVRTSGGRKLDTMFISCQGETDGLGGEDEARNDTSVSASKEETPLKSASEPAFTGPTMIWCNPNAAYYETMVYDSQWLEFYTQQGWNLFLFNYSGYGRSTGHPTPHRMRVDGDAIVEFLRKRGVTTIGVHGRSVGGIVGCHLAANHPDVVKFMVADRTFQTLHGIAKYMVGDWASKALSFAAMWANNEESFAKASCYKVIIRDPKDSTIPELSSMCTAVAFQALQRVAPSDVFIVEDERLQQIADAWLFFDVLFSVYDRDDCSEGSRCSGRSTPHAEAKRPARQPALGNPSAADGSALEAGEEDTQRLVAANRARTEARDCVISIQWLEENADVVRTAMAQHVDLIRSALDVVGTQLNAAGTSLDEALGRGYAFDQALFSLKCFLANLQVWGSVGSLREPLCPGVDKDIELFLMRRSETSDTAPELVCRLANISATLTPEKLSTYHRQLSRALVAQVRRDFRSRLSSIRRAIEPCMKDDNPVVSKLYSATLAHLREVESFISSIHRFFKCVDLACEDPASLAESGLSRGPTISSGDGLTTGDSSEEGCDSAPRPPRPTFDRALTGYGVWVDCGHNGVLCEGEIQHFALHLKAAGFGRYAGGSQSHEREERKTGLW